jgi:hypothetical protein
MALTTASAVQAEGAFVKEQFGLADDAGLEELLEERIDEASAEIQRLVGADTYGTTDSVVATILTTAEKYAATSKVFQTMANIAIAWDQEVLPSEFVDEAEIRKSIERYRARSSEMLEPYALGVDTGARPVLMSASIRVVRAPRG